jgi:hypothetical protein
MADHDDIPAADAPDSPSERARATGFGRLIDGAIDGAGPPAALGTDERALLETATMIRAGAGRELALDPVRRRAIVDDAIARALGADSGSSHALPAATSTDELRARRLQHLAPWVVTAVAVAAAFVLWLRPPTDPGRTAVAPPSAIERRVPIEWRSRPSDALVGKIAREDAGAARARIDTS